MYRMDDVNKELIDLKRGFMESYDASGARNLDEYKAISSDTFGLSDDVLAVLTDAVNDYKQTGNRFLWDTVLESNTIVLAPFPTETIETDVVKLRETFVKDYLNSGADGFNEFQMLATESYALHEDEQRSLVAQTDLYKMWQDELEMFQHLLESARKRNDRTVDRDVSHYMEKIDDHKFLINQFEAEYQIGEPEYQIEEPEAVEVNDVHEPIAPQLDGVSDADYHDLNVQYMDFDKAIAEMELLRDEGLVR